MADVISLEPQKTRMEDWTERRNELLLLPSPSAYESMQIKVLEYLIERYRDSPVAIAPARFSPRTRFYLNRRMIVVHEHLRLDRGRPSCSRTNAEQRIQTSLQKFSEKATVPEPEVITAPRSHEPLPQVAQKNWLLGLSEWISECIRSERKLPKQRSNWLTNRRTKFKKLVSRLSNTKTQDLAALVGLESYENEGLHHVFTKLWRIRVLADVSKDLVLAGLEAKLCRAPHVEHTAETMREFLGDEPAKLRLAALKVLERIGNLDDIGLLADLLRLPVAELSPEEPTALMAAMQAIAQRADSLPGNTLDR
ncbi:MAG: hypothetical protein Q8M16_15855 [Pirellulaceae bacterium]|nr:hypothetical protein [Pirellulaceae bacterium]